jgi:hypothetical protein
MRSGAERKVGFMEKVKGVNPMLLSDRITGKSEESLSVAESIVANAERLVAQTIFDLHVFKSVNPDYTGLEDDIKKVRDVIRAMDAVRHGIYRLIELKSMQ